jgi:hypothetical protein
MVMGKTFLCCCIVREETGALGQLAWGGLVLALLGCEAGPRIRKRAGRGGLRGKKRIKKREGKSGPHRKRRKEKKR